MSERSRPRPGGSRTPTGRPRKVAGRTPAPEPVVVEDEPTPDEGTGDVEAEAPVEEDGAPPAVSDPSVSTPATSKPRRSRLTAILVVTCVVLALVGVAEIVYLANDPSPTISSKRPVVTGELSHRTAVDAAARATEEILSTSYQDYDGQVDKATDKMTDTFAAQYRKTSEGIKDEFIKQQTKVQMKTVAQSVVQASPQQVQALLFLNQYVEKVQDGQPRTSFAQYRALVTMVHTDHGWLVSNIETQ